MITDLIDSRAGYSSSTVNVGYVSTRSKIFNYIQSIHTVMGASFPIIGGASLLMPRPSRIPYPLITFLLDYLYIKTRDPLPVALLTVDDIQRTATRIENA